MYINVNKSNDSFTQFNITYIMRNGGVTHHLKRIILILEILDSI